ncbi:MAG: DUF4169 family protein [Alphaproteobacteria bacterium]|nr:DUF4169 family protein [Alphaproteobacteria bacterium]
MADIVNLNKFRKKREASAAERRAAENRKSFGLTKEERTKLRHERDRAKKDLDDKRIE